MLDISLYTKSCKDEAELAVCQMLLNKVPAERELEFDILYNAADRMDEDDVLTSVDKVVVALINCDDEDIRVMSHAELASACEELLFSGVEPPDYEGIIHYFDCERVVSDAIDNLEYELADGGFSQDNQGLYDYLNQRYYDLNSFSPNDEQAFALYILKGNWLISVPSEYFDAQQYALDTISNPVSFGTELYDKNNTVVSIPNFNYDIAQPLALVCEELVHATRNGEPTEALTQEAMDIVDALVDTSVAQNEQIQSIDDLIKAADGYFTLPEGMQSPEKTDREDR